MLNPEMEQAEDLSLHTSRPKSDFIDRKELKERKELQEIAPVVLSSEKGIS